MTTFEMATDSAAPTRAGSVLVPFERRWATSWEDLDADHTLLHVEHPPEDTADLVARVLGADQGVRLVA